MRETWLPTTTVLRREYSSFLQETRRRKEIAVETDTLFAADYVKSTTALISRNSVDISNLISVKEVITQEEYCSGIQVIHSSLRTTIRVLFVIVLTKQRRDLWQRELVSFTESILGSSWRHYWILYLLLSSWLRYRICVIHCREESPHIICWQHVFWSFTECFQGKRNKIPQESCCNCLFVQNMWQMRKGQE